MLFSKSLRLLSLVASMLPALLVSASPHSLAERAGPSIDLQLYGFTPANSDRILYDPVKLTPLPVEGKQIYRVEGGWNGQSATVEQVPLHEYLDWRASKLIRHRLLAWGNDNNSEDETFYVIVKDQPLKLNGYDANWLGNTDSPKNFPEVNLFPILEEVGKYIVIGGWHGTSATAKRLLDNDQYDTLVQEQPDNLLAYGYNSRGSGEFYAIFEDSRSV